MATKQVRNRQADESSIEVLSAGKAKGGHARAQKLSPEARKEIAKKAATARWGPSVPVAKHKGVLKIGDTELPCFVLANGQRVISGRAITSAIGMKGRGQGSARIAALLRQKGNKDNELALAIENPLVFDSGAPIATQGYEATVLVQLCEAVLDAREAGLLKTEQEKRYGDACLVLTRAFAKVGIIALVDEATGYQRERAADALSKILEAFIAKELQPYVPTFPGDYYEQLFRLRGLDFKTDSVKRPQYFGKLTNDIIYRRLAPGVLEELKKVVRRNENGRPTQKYFQSLTSNKGYPKLNQHLGAVVAIMKLSSDYHDFIHKLNEQCPPYGQNMSFAFEGEGSTDDGRGL